MPNRCSVTEPGIGLEGRIWSKGGKLKTFSFATCKAGLLASLSSLRSRFPANFCWRLERSQAEITE